MKFQVHPRERFYFLCMILGSIAVASYILAATFYFDDFLGFVYLGLLAFLFTINVFFSFIYVGFLRGNGIKISNKQFPEAYELLHAHAQKLQLKKVPDMYVVQGSGILNAFALRFLMRDYVVLNSGVLELAYQEGKDALSFVIGHELGHIKRKHTGFLKTMLLLPAELIPFLSGAYSRAREYTCDNIGYALCPEGALKGMLILGIGSKLHARVNVDELIFSSCQQAGFVTKFAELFSTHPLLAKRIAVFDQLNKEKLDFTAFISPKFDLGMQEKQG